MAWEPLPIVTGEQDVTGLILQALRLRIPGWEPEEGQLDVAIVEEVGREIAALRALTVDVAAAAVVQVGRTLFGLPQIAGAAATMAVRLTMTASGRTAPAGLTVIGRTPDGIDVAFTLPIAATAAGTTVDVSMTASSVGAHANGVPAGALRLLQASLDVVSAAALTPSANGLDAEPDLLYLDRLTATLGTLRQGFVHAVDAAVLARGVSGVHRALGIDGLNPGRSVADGVTTAASTTVTSATAAFTPADIGRTIAGAGIPAGATVAAVGSATSITISAAATATATGVTLTLGDLTGQQRTVTVVPINSAGQPVPAGTATSVRQLLESLREVNFQVFVGSPTYTAVNVTFTAVADTGAATADVQAAVHTAALEFLDPARWAEGDDPTQPTWRPVTSVRYLDLARVMGSAPGVAYLSSLTINGGTADLPLAGRAPLPAPPNAAVPTTVTGTVT